MVSIKRARQGRGLTLAEVAARSGLLPQAISRAERAGTDLRVSTALVLARAMDVPLCELLDDEAIHGTHQRRRRPQRGR